MNEDSAKFAYAIAIVAGTVLWVLTAVLGGRNEPWDAPVYWTVAYPVAIVLAGVLGYAFPQRPWRWAVVLMFTQVAVVLFGGSGFGLLPLGLIFLGILSLPAIALASLGSRIGLRNKRQVS
jgi:peptidoglycan/LPS O-acetylase OafA/YrhL